MNATNTSHALHSRGGGGGGATEAALTPLSLTGLAQGLTSQGTVLRVADLSFQVLDAWRMSAFNAGNRLGRYLDSTN